MIGKRNLVSGLMLALLATAGHAQVFVRPIRLIVPYPPGGSFDGPARLLATQISKLAGQSVIVENRGGASGAIGAAEVARALPDGHTLLLSSSALAVSSALSKGSRVDAVKDFRHTAIFAAVPVVIVANPQRVPFATWSDFINASKAAPAKYSYGSAGTGSPGHLGAELLKQTFGVDWLHVPYKGTGPAIQDVMAGQIDFSIAGLSAVLPHIRAGTLKPLAVTDKARLAQLPQVPAISELVKGFEYSIWLGISAPANTPAATVAQLDRYVQTTIADPDFQKRLFEAGVKPEYAGSSATTARVLQEVNDFTNIGRRTGISLD